MSDKYNHAMPKLEPVAPLRYFVFVGDEEYDGAEAFELAEFLIEDVMGDSNGQNSQPVYTIRNQDDSVLSSFTHGRIVGSALKPIANAQGFDADAEAVSFDATTHVMALSYADLMALQDGGESANFMGQAHAMDAEQCHVKIVERICAHFGVKALAQITQSHFESVRKRWQRVHPPTAAMPPEPEPKLVTPRSIGEFVDGVSDRAGVPRRTPKAVAGRLLEEVVELALAAGVAPGEIFTHVTDSLHNQALKASRKTGKTVFPSQLQEVEGDEEGIAGECADVSMVFKDFCWVANIEGLDKIEALKNQCFTRLGDYRVAPNGCIYRHKPHVKTGTER